MTYLSARIFARFFAVALLAIALPACDHLLGPEALHPTEAGGSLGPSGHSGIETHPGGPLVLMPGDTIRLRASLRGGSAATFAFEAVDTSVVRINPGGLVTALKPGATQIRVRLTSNPQVGAEIATVVRSRGVSAVRIAGLSTPAGTPLRDDSVAGRALAHVKMSRGDAARLEVLVDTLLLCSAVLPPTSPESPATPEESASCVMDTAAHDPKSYAPMLFNGRSVLSARLLSVEGQVLAASEARSITLANRDTLLIAVTPEARVLDAAQRPWAGGDLSIQAVPVLYARDRAIGGVGLWYHGPDGLLWEHFAAEPPVRVVLPRSRLAGVLDESLRIFGSTVLHDGTAGPVGYFGEILYDGVPPPVGKLESRDWIGAEITFASLYTPPADRDRGVGRSAPSFFVGSPGQPPDSIFAGGKSAVRGSDLRDSAPAAYRVEFQVCDALMNCARGAGFDFGVDLRPPTVTSVSIDERTVNPVGALRVRLEDQGSGLPAKPLMVRVGAILANAAAPVCGPVVAGVRLPGALVGSACVAEAAGTVHDLPGADAPQGYYFYSVTAVDRAGNRTAIADRIVLVDRAAPRILSFRVPASVTPGSEFTLEAAVEDDVDLASIDFHLTFGSAGTLPFSGTIDIGRPFTGAVTRSHLATARMPLVRTLTTLDRTTRSTALVSAVGGRVVDAAGLSSAHVQPIPPATFGGNTSITDPFAVASAMTLAAPSTRVCSHRCAPNDVASVPVTVQIAGDAGMSSFGQLFLFARQADGLVVPLGSATSFSVVETGTQRTYRYNVSILPPEGLRGSYALFGVAVNAAGNGLKSTEAAVEFFTR